MSTFTAPSDAVPVTLARSNTPNFIIDAVEIAFGLLPDEQDLYVDKAAYGTCTTSSTNAYLVTLDNTPSGYTDGMGICFKAISTNTGAATVNVNGLGVKSLKRHAGDALSAGDLLAGKIYQFRFNSSVDSFEMQQAALSELTGGASISVSSSSLADDHAPTLGANLKVSEYSFVDQSENEYIEFDNTASAVNNFKIRNAAPLTGPRLEASGSDTNIDIDIVPKGTGAVNLGDAPLKRAKLMDYSETVASASSSSNSLELDLEVANNFTVTLAENVTTFNITNWLASSVQTVTIFLTQGAVAYTVDWSGVSVMWPSGTAPDLTTTSSKHIIQFVSPDGGTSVFGSHSIKNAAEPA